MKSVILHCDMNSFYASVESLYHPELRGRPLAVGGNPQKRQGIILAKNEVAKKAGVKTGETLAQAKSKCPGLVVLLPDYNRYLRFSQLARKIYSEYSNLVEPFGLDEAWIDVTGSKAMHGSGFEIARKISQRVWKELGLTLSIGVSFNKIFAKFGSDYKKPDAITLIDRDNYKDIVWEQEVGSLLYVGLATGKKLSKYGIVTIGELAGSSPEFLKIILGKMGVVLWEFANGLDESPVKNYDENGNHQIIKSIGNSKTAAFDLENLNDVKIMIYTLSESVAMRLREINCFCRGVSIELRSNNLESFSRQAKFEQPTDLTNEIAEKAITLFKKNYSFGPGLRSIGVRVSELLPNTLPIQMDIFNREEKRLRLARIDQANDHLRRRFGNLSIFRAILLESDLGKLDVKKDHIIHPVGYF